MTDERTAAFFAGHETALPLYETFEERLFEAFPDAHRKVQKTQITFSNKHVFACVSFLRVRKKADLPSPYIVITLGLSYPPGIQTGRRQDGTISRQMDHAYRSRR